MSEGQVSTSDFTEATAADAVLRSFKETADPRFRHVLESLVLHLHSFVRDVELTPPEWQNAIDFLTATGQKCDPHRQEFILLSDVLGVSMLVDAVNHRRPPRATPSTVLGPFHVVHSPALELGASIALHEGGEPCVVSGRVLSTDGQPLPGARIDVWQANDEGLYDVQRPDELREGHLRGLFRAGTDGCYWFRTILPAPYPIPDDGPVGRLLRLTGRHPNRPAHVHFIAEAEGHDPVTTHVFVAGSPWLDSDAVFGVKQSLVRDFRLIDDPVEARRWNVPVPFRHAEFDIVLQRNPGGSE